MPVSRQDTRGRLGEIRTYDRRQILQSAVRRTTPGPGTAPPGRPIRPKERPSARDDPKSPHVEGVSGPPGAAWGRQARGGGSAAGTVEDSVGQQATLTSCQPGSDTPGSPVGLWAGDRPPSAQVRTIIPPQVHRPGQSGNPPLRQAGSRLLVNPDIIHVERGRRRHRTIGITAPTRTTDIEIEHHDTSVSRWDVRRPTSPFGHYLCQNVTDSAVPLHLK